MREAISLNKLMSQIIIESMQLDDTLHLRIRHIPTKAIVYGSTQSSRYKLTKKLIDELRGLIEGGVG